MKKMIVLGAGLIGQTIAIDLCKDFEVTSADINLENLNKLKSKHPIQTTRLDFTNTQKIKEVVYSYDLVIGAVPGFMGFETLKTVISAGKNIVDISFFAEDPFLLDDLAKQNNVTAVVDCGVAPGMSNIILGYHNSKMQIQSFECMVGGLPFIRDWPYQYKAPFSPVDVIEEYTRPARLVENGYIITKPALSDLEYVHFDEIGTLEAFNTDGLRTLLKTMKIPNMKEKTLRYPDHIHYIQVLKETGFLDKTPIEINGVKIRPIDFTSKLLFPKWKLKEGDEEFTIMEIKIEGKEGDFLKQYVYQVLDRYDKKTNTSSMARTTGYTCTAVARLVIDNKFNQKGICPPEYIGANEECFDFVMNYFKERGVIYRKYEI
jgi:saccharopine dehydrogenase-like NADP-dependent oxidoreductase